jgi:hypothetical protein
MLKPPTYSRTVDVMLGAAALTGLVLCLWSWPSADAGKPSIMGHAFTLGNVRYTVIRSGQPGLVDCISADGQHLGISPDAVRYLEANK